MHITRVELTNIKSYEHASIRLRDGVTAIRGHNGAGKSTLLEAIGWALFDHLPYKQKQFVREGANTGKVMVAFVSPVDECEYEVTRRLGASSDWYIFNPLTGTRIDSSADVTDFLKHHMRIDGAIKLDDLFASAIGTPQGMLTADFLLTPAVRKTKFDKLLQVEDYGDAAKKLIETAKYLREQEADQAVRIAGLERDVAQIDVWRRERDERQQTRVATARELEALGADLERIEALVNQLNEMKAEVAQREGAATAAEATHTAAERRLAQAAQLLGESRAAAQILTETRADHDAYLQSEKSRADAQQRVRQRETLSDQRAEVAKRHERAKADERHAQERIDLIAQAERRVTELQPALAQQISLESARDTAHQNVARLNEFRAQLEDRGAKRVMLERRVAERQREVAEIEAARPVAEALAERRKRVESLQAVAAQRQQHEQRRAAIATERAEVASARAKATALQARQQQNLRKLESYRPLVERIPELTETHEAADQAAREIETRLQQHRQSREQSGMGLCPFLREPCQNIRQRGENSLATYFDRLISVDEVALLPAQAKRNAAAKQLEDANKAAAVYAQLENFNDQLRQANEQLDTCETTEGRLSAELAEIQQALALAGDTEGLAEARRALRESEAADKKLATAAGAQRELDDHRERLRDLSDELARIEATCADLAGAPEAERAAIAALTRLGDPRGEVAGKQALASERPTVEQRLAQARAAISTGDAELARLDAALAPFATLAQELVELDITMKRTQPGHTKYLQHQRAAEQLDERTREHAAAIASDAETAKDARLAAEALAEARKRFDPQALDAAHGQANGLRSRRGELWETQRHTEELLGRLEAHIAQCERQLLELESARIECEDLRDTQRMLDQFRETIKEAGPLVTQRMLKDISAQANTIFGEIMGDRAAELSWQDEYEIVLKRGSSVRTFALLSGGEQMAAALATRLALLRRLTGLDLAFFDEPTQNMDAERRSALAEQIRRVRGFDQLIVISHDDTFEQGLDSVIHLEKRGGATYVCDDDASFATSTPFSDGFDGDRVAERARESVSESFSALFAD
ncbi:MAG TPA: SMC family ATPase [Ktedonobacterales bacterium]